MKKIIVTALFFVSAFPALALINGAIVPPGDYQEIVSVSNANGEQCSGVLIGPRVVATAAHCVRRAASAIVHFQNGESGLAHFEASALYPSKDHNLALGVLVTEANVAPAWLAGRKVNVGESITLTGFGCTDVSVPSDGRLRAGNSTITEIEVFNLRTGGKRHAAACYGDSGAPGFVAGERPREVAGLITMGNLSDLTYLVRLDTVDSESFLEEFTHKHGVEICGFQGGCENRCARSR